MSVSSDAQHYTTKNGANKSNKKTFWNEPLEDRKATTKPAIDYDTKVKADIKKNKFDAGPQVTNVAIYCTEKWEGDNCYRSLSELSAKVTRGFSKTLKASIYGNYIDPLNKGCAASNDGAMNAESTKAAMYQSMAVCVNIMEDTAIKTRLKPDVNMYQVMVGSVLCLKPDQACAHIDNQLKAFLP